MTETQPNPLPADFCAHLLDHLFDAVYAIDTNAVIVYWNRSCQRLTGYTAAEVLGKHYDEMPFAYGDDVSRLHTQRTGLRMTLETGMAGTWKGYVRRKDGQRVPIHAHISPIRDADGAIVGAAEVFRDSSALVALEEAHKEALRVARRDQLTGLHNRPATIELLEAEFERARRYHQNLAVIMADIDHFKRFNDRYGHDMGDRVLAQVAEILSNNLRKPDTVGRWGGEEFLIIAPGSDGPAAASLAERVRQYVETIRLEEVDEPVTASFGVSPLAADQNRDELLYVADMALYRAKDAGRNRVVIGDAALMIPASSD